jgi:hypothetical protein
MKRLSQANRCHDPDSNTNVQPDDFDDNGVGDDQGEYVSVSGEENNGSYFCETKTKWPITVAARS